LFDSVNNILPLLLPVLTAAITQSMIVSSFDCKQAERDAVCDLLIQLTAAAAPSNVVLFTVDQISDGVSSVLDDIGDMIIDTPLVVSVSLAAGAYV
jgi:hypothetical protein